MATALPLSDAISCEFMSICFSTQNGTFGSKANMLFVNFTSRNDDARICRQLLEDILGPFEFESDDLEFDRPE